MADKNLARNRNDGPEFFADDDPLAELARIVGYDERLVPKPPVAERREPAFNLEDELLAEFERYDAPRPHSTVAIAGEGEAAVVSQNILAEPYMRADTASGEAGDGIASELEWSAAQDIFGLQGEGHDADIASVEQPVYVETPFDLGPPQGEVEPVRWGRDGEQAATAVPLPAEGYGTADNGVETVQSVSEADKLAPSSQASTLDLVDELELTFQEGPHAEGPVDVAQSPVAPPRKTGYTPGFRMPLANFNARDAIRSEEEQQQSAFREDVSLDDAAKGLEAISPSIAVPGFVERDDIARGESLAQPNSDATDAAVDLQSLDALIVGLQDEVDLSVQPVTSTPADLTVEEEQDQASEPPMDPENDTQPVFVEQQDASDGSFGATMAIADEPDPLFDDDFELALDDLELDLTDMMADDDQAAIVASAPVVSQPEAVQQQPNETAPAFVPVNLPPPVAASPVTASWSPVGRFVPTSADRAGSSTPAPMMPVEPAAVPVGQPAAAVASEAVDLPFDPAQIAENDELPEVVADLNVPQLHFEEPAEEKPDFRADYEYDIDAELAALLDATPAVAAAGEQAIAPRQVLSDAPAPQSAAAYPDLKEFQQTLEEDVRRSMAEPSASAGFAEEEVRSTGYSIGGSRWSLSSAAMPLAVAGIVIVGASIGYALLGPDGGSTAGSGEPVVIAADTDPVKVLPENPGGKTVPNQDQAVYDRVSGAAVDAPKQETLISTSEEPIDVVQKTLMTSTLPMEGEELAESAGSMPAARIEDDRLLPQDSDLAALPEEPAQQQPVSVMPRRVKTMIVRPDGTLVEQELPEPTPVATVAETPVEATPESGNAPAEVASVAPADAVEDSAATSTGQAPAAETSANAPIPTARPATQPVDVVASVSDQGNVRASEDVPAQPSPATQVAAVPPGDYLIQIASLPSEADARKSYENLTAKFGSIIGGRGVDIKQAEIAGKGTFYRVRIPAGSKADAVALCEKYRAAGGSCLVAR